jgi:hypothetical protein
MSSPSKNSARRATVQALAAELRQRGVFCAGDVAERESVAIPATRAAAGGIEWILQRLRGNREGSGLSEWLSDGEGAGAAQVVFAVWRALRRDGNSVVLVEGARPLFPPALEALGVDLDEAVLVRPPSEQDRWWAIEQALRCRGAGGVIAWVERASEKFLRRLQLAVEHGGGRGFLIRPAEARREKCWGDVRFLVHPRPSEESDLDRGRRRVEIEVLAGRGGIAVAGQTAVAEICDATGAVCLVPRLADSTAARRPARA